MVGSSRPTLESTGESDYYFEFNLGLSVDKIQIERSNYTLLQFVGDIGALNSTLFAIAALILSVLFKTDVLM
jgi:hypothetical protein